MDKQEIRQQVDQLIDMYKSYQAVAQRQADCRRELAKAKLRQVDTMPLQVAYDTATAELQAISDAMTYASPSVWMLYKYEAYANEAQPIRTMHDFRVHCSKPGYICTKRYEFTNAALVERGLAPLSDDTVYPDALSLGKALTAVTPLERDELFMSAWGGHEYYRDGDRVAKWENI